MDSRISIRPAAPEDIAALADLSTQLGYPAEAETIGVRLTLVRSATENAEARKLFREAIDLDPTFARAYAGLAMTYALYLMPRR